VQDTSPKAILQRAEPPQLRGIAALSACIQLLYVTPCRINGVPHRTAHRSNKGSVHGIRKLGFSEDLILDVSRNVLEGHDTRVRLACRI